MTRLMEKISELQVAIISETLAEILGIHKLEDMYIRICLFEILSTPLTGLTSSFLLIGCLERAENGSGQGKERKATIKGC